MGRKSAMSIVIAGFIIVLVAIIVFAGIQGRGKPDSADALERKRNDGDLTMMGYHESGLVNSDRRDR